jgi:MFS family permease
VRRRPRHGAVHHRTRVPPSRCAGRAEAPGRRPAPGPRNLRPYPAELIAIWALGGLFLSLGPSLAAQATGSANLLPGGLLIFALFGAGAGSAYALRTIGSRAALLAGCLLLIAGMAFTFGAVATTTSAVFYAGAVVAGAGFGLVSLGSFRLPTAQASPGQRAGLVAAVYIAGYLAFSIPALIAGVTTTRYGLHATALVYAVAVAVLAAAAAGVMLVRPGDKPGQPAAASPEGVRR